MSSINAAMSRGFITNDAGVLELAREMIVLSHTRLVLIVNVGVGHDPIRATGLLMVSLEQIARRYTGRPEIFRLHPVELNRNRITPGTQLNRIAARRHVPPNELISRERSVLRDKGVQL